MLKLKYKNKEDVMDYIPKGPYVLSSGDHANESLELLALNDFAFLEQQLKIRKQKNRGEKEITEIHQHLEWMLNILKKIKPTAICPICRRERVTHFMIQTIGEYTIISENDMCCKNCRENLLEKAHLGTPCFIPITFFSMDNFYRYNNKKRRLVPKPSLKKAKKILLRAFEIEKTSRQYMFQWLQKKSKALETNKINIGFEGDQEIILF